MSPPLISQNQVKSSDINSVHLHIIISVHISLSKPFCFPWLSKMLDPRKCCAALLPASWSSDLVWKMCC